MKNCTASAHRLSMRREVALDKAFSFDLRALSLRVIRAVMRLERCPCKIAVSILLTGEAQMSELNLAERGIFEATDVLSFPSVDFQNPADYEDENFLKACRLSGNEPVFLGDIAISLPRVLTQAKRYCHSLRREYAFLLTHSLLHLLGYDHLSKEEERKMREKQNAVLKELKILRSGR